MLSGISMQHCWMRSILSRIDSVHYRTLLGVLSLVHTQVLAFEMQEHWCLLNATHPNKCHHGMLPHPNIWNGSKPCREWQKIHQGARFTFSTRATKHESFRDPLLHIVFCFDWQPKALLLPTLWVFCDDSSAQLSFKSKNQEIFETRGLGHASQGLD